MHVTLSADDGSGSGVQKIRYTTDGTNPSPVNGSDYSGTIDVASTTTIKFRAYDNLGNEEAVGSQDVLLDGTPPNLSLTLAENPASGAQHVSGTTLFYRPGAGGGTFRVTATTDDPQTGVTSVDFPSVANVTGGSSQTSSPYQRGLHLERGDNGRNRTQRRRDQRRRRHDLGPVHAHARTRRRRRDSRSR